MVPNSWRPTSTLRDVSPFYSVFGFHLHNRGRGQQVGIAETGSVAEASQRAVEVRNWGEEFKPYVEFLGCDLLTVFSAAAERMGVMSSSPASPVRNSDVDPDHVGTPVIDNMMAIRSLYPRLQLSGPGSVLAASSLIAVRLIADAAKVRHDSEAFAFPGQKRGRDGKMRSRSPSTSTQGGHDNGTTKNSASRSYRRRAGGNKRLSNLFLNPKFPAVGEIRWMMP